MDTAIKTPETHPDHHTVGHRFKAWDGAIYYCDSYDPRQGYWMSREDGSRRVNVSEGVIGRTFHIIYTIDGREYCKYGPINP